MNPILQEISAIQHNPEDVYVIHCAQYRDDTKNHYPKRVSCIYAQNLNGSGSSNFSIDQYAKRSKIEMDDIVDWYDDLEIAILDEFNTFLRMKQHCTFIYWVEDGQELILDTIKARYDELNQEDSKSFYTLATSNRKTIQYLVKKVHPISVGSKDLKLFIKQHNNEQLIAGFLNNAEESICFETKEFSKIEGSVMAKVAFFVSLINECCNVDLKQKKDRNNGAVDIQALSPLELIRRLNIKSWAWLIGIYVGSAGIGTYFYAHQVADLKNQNTQLQTQLTDQKQQFGDSLKIYRDSLIKKSN